MIAVTYLPTAMSAERPVLREHGSLLQKTSRRVEKRRGAPPVGASHARDPAVEQRPAMISACFASGARSYEKRRGILKPSRCPLCRSEPCLRSGRRTTAGDDQRALRERCSLLRKTSRRIEKRRGAPPVGASHARDPVVEQRRAMISARCREHGSLLRHALGIHDSFSSRRAFSCSTFVRTPAFHASLSKSSTVCFIARKG